MLISSCYVAPQVMVPYMGTKKGNQKVTKKSTQLNVEHHAAEITKIRKR